MRPRLLQHGIHGQTKYYKMKCRYFVMDFRHGNRNATKCWFKNPDGCPDLISKNVGSSTLAHAFLKHHVFFCFSPRAFLPRLDWAASRHWDCFYTGQSPDVQSPKAKSIGKSGGMGGEAAGVCGVRGELCKEVTEGGGFALEIVMGGRVFENEGGCKCSQCRMCEESGPSGDEGGGGGLAQQCWGVACFGSGEVGDERGGFPKF